LRHLIAALFAWVASLAHAGPTTIGFEGLSDQEALSGQYPGLTFQGGMVLLTGPAGGSLNELDFPPHGGVAAAMSDAPVQIDFTSPVSQVSAYFTYIGGLRLSAFDGMGSLLGSAQAGFSNNTALGGDFGSQANEFLGLSAIGDIRRIVIESVDPLGGVFVFDDLGFNTDPVVQGLPEPAGWALGAVAALTAVASRRRRHA
jgi:hypothetical protein